MDDLRIVSAATESIATEQADPSEAVVTGLFRLTSEDRQHLHLPETISLRRRQKGTIATFELKSLVPSDERLRQLGTKKLPELKRLAQQLGTDTSGQQNRRDTFLEPLQAYTATVEHIEDWIEASRDLIKRLPRFMPFASTEAPDPEQEVKTWLSEEYERVVGSEEIAGSIAEIETQIQDRLQTEAHALRDHIRSRCEDHTDLEVVPSVSFRSGLSVALHHAGSPAHGGIRLRNAGAGSKRRVTLAVWEWVSDLLGLRDDENPSLVIAYDEPDTHLDYLRQRELIDLIKSQAQLEGIQVIVVTHSLNLIDNIDIRGVVHLQIMDGQSTAHRLLTQEHKEISRHLRRIASSMGLRNSVLLHERCFFVVEGSTETQSVPILFHTATGLTLQAAGIAVMAGNSNIGAFEVARFLRVNGRTVRFMVDADTERDRSTRKLFTPSRLQKYGFKKDHIYYVGNPSDIEDLFSDEMWASVANKEWPRDNGTPWLADDFSGLRHTEKSFGSQLEALVRPESSRAPNGKPGYLLAISENVETRDQVPDQLCDIFHDLLQVANA